MKRLILFGTALFSLTILLLAGCSGQKSQAHSSQGTGDLPQAKAETGQDIAQLKEFTLEELAQYDGANGKPAYIALNGLIYDVTNLKGWKEGVHRLWSNNRMAGKDLTSEIFKAPASHRQKDFFADIPVVGRLRASTSDNQEGKN